MTPPAPGKVCELFFALQPEAEDAERISAQAGALRRALNLGHGSLVSALRLHVSLYGLGSHETVPNGLLARALNAASRLEFPAFEVAFDQLQSFGRPHASAPAKARQPLVLTSSVPQSALEELHLRLGMALADAGVSLDRRFSPHMTLSRHATLVPSQAIEPLRWTARRFVLIWSHVGLTRYEWAGEWPLA